MQWVHSSAVSHYKNVGGGFQCNQLHNVYEADVAGDGEPAAPRKGEAMSNVTEFPGRRVLPPVVDDARRIIEAIEVGNPAASRITAVLSQVHRELDCLELALEYAERDPKFDVEWLPSDRQRFSFKGLWT